MQSISVWLWRSRWIANIHRPDIDAIHQRVALALQVDSEHSGRTEALLPHDKFAVLVENRLKEEGHEDSELQELKNRIISTALERLVFLVAPESEAVGFDFWLPLKAKPLALKSALCRNLWRPNA